MQLGRGILTDKILKYHMEIVQGEDLNLEIEEPLGRGLL